MTAIYLRHNNLCNEELAEIIDALSEYKQLESFYAEEEFIDRNEKYYDMLAQIIDLNHITSCKKNAEILRKLRDNGWDGKEALVVIDWDPESDDVMFLLGEDDDWGWLGYFIGQSKQIRELTLADRLPQEEDEVEAFMDGLCRNDSIEHLQVVRCEIDFVRLSPFIIHNSNLKSLDLLNVNIGLENARILAMALRQRQHKSLTKFCLRGNNIEDDAFGEIAAVLSDYPHLESFDVSTNLLIGREGCESLGAVIRSASSHLKRLYLFENNFEDEDLQILVAALTNASSLRRLNLSSNRSITATGLGALPRLFHSSCPLETLLLDKINIGNDGAGMLANGLIGNSSLKHLAITPGSAGITSAGWNAFSRLLCDDSSLNNTYQSNHTLEHIGGDYHYTFNPDGGPNLFCSKGSFQDIPSNVARYLKTNKKYSVKDAAKVKIANSHPDIPVEAFFRYKLKLLPFLVSWFVRFGTRKRRTLQKLSTVYKFIRGMPVLVVDSQLKCSCGRKRKHDE